MKHILSSLLILSGLFCTEATLLSGADSPVKPPVKKAVKKQAPAKISFRIRGRRAFFRNEKKALLQCVMDSDSAVKNLSASLRIKGVRPQSVRIKAADGQKKYIFHVPVETRLRVGSYPAELLFSCTLNGKKYSRKIKDTIRIAPQRNEDVMPVILWGYSGLEREKYRAFQKIGFTVGMNYTSPCRITLNSSNLERDRAKFMKYYDDVLCDGFAIGDFFYIGALAAFAKKYPRIDRNGKVRQPICPDASHPEVVRECVKLAEKVGQNFKDHPAVVYTLVHSEVRDRAQPSFYDHNKKQYKAFSGSEIPETVETRSAPHYSKIKEVPFSRLIPSNHPLYTYYKYYWVHGDGWNDLNTKIHKAYKKYMPKSFLTIHDPAVRVPPVWGSGGDVDILSHWTYAYPEPSRVAITTLQTHAMASGKGQIVMNMTQLFGYRQVLAPSSVKVKNVPQWAKDHPKARYITLPPDMLSIAIWSQLSRETKAVMFHGLASLVKPQKKQSPSSYLYTHSSSLKVLQDFLNNVVHVFGPALMKVPERKAPVALLESFTSSIFAERSTFGVSGWVFDASLALDWANMGHRIVYEESILRGDLSDGVKVLVLPGCDVLTKEVFDKIKAFQKKGGIIVGDEFLVPHITPDVLWKSVPRGTKDTPQQKKAFQNAGLSLRKALDTIYTPPARTSNADLLAHVRSSGKSDYLFVINDKRTYGDYVGQYGHTMEKGLPNAGSVTLNRSARAVYDLLARKEIPFISHKNKTTLPVSLKGGEGRLYLILDQKIASVSVKAQGNTRKGAVVRLSAKVADAEGRLINGVVPLKVTVTDPGGKKSDESRYTAAVNGIWQLDLTLPLNNPSGKWAVTVEELASGKSSRIRF